MGRKKKDKPRKRKKTKPTVYFRDGEVLDGPVLVSEDGTTVHYRTVMAFCPDPLLAEIDNLSDFNYIERSDFVSIATQLLLDYLDVRNSEEIAVLAPEGLDDDETPEDILMSAELYPYEDDDEGYGELWAAEDEDDTD